MCQCAPIDRCWINFNWIYWLFWLLLPLLLAWACEKFSLSSDKTKIIPFYKSNKMISDAGVRCAFSLTGFHFYQSINFHSNFRFLLEIVTFITMRVMRFDYRNWSFWLFWLRIISRLKMPIFLTSNVLPDWNVLFINTLLTMKHFWHIRIT